MKENGKAATIEAVCKPFNPPLIRRTLAVAANSTPQIKRVDIFGFKFPFEARTPKTYVAESADVTKKIKINNTATNAGTRLVEPIKNQAM